MSNIYNIRFSFWLNGIFSTVVQNLYVMSVEITESENVELSCSDSGLWVKTLPLVLHVLSSDLLWDPWEATLPAVSDTAPQITELCNGSLYFKISLYERISFVLHVEEYFTRLTSASFCTQHDYWIHHSMIFFVSYHYRMCKK